MLQPYSWLQGIGADNKLDYAGLYYYDTMEDYQKYWNEDGSPNELGAAAMAKFQPLFEEWSKLGVFNYTTSDWMIQK